MGPTCCAWKLPLTAWPIVQQIGSQRLLVIKFEVSHHFEKCRLLVQTFQFVAAKKKVFPGFAEAQISLAVK